MGRSYIGDKTMSKGSDRRPCSIDKKQFDKNWDAIFKKERQERGEKPAANRSLLEKS